jgi:hypothetical protein
LKKRILLGRTARGGEVDVEVEVRDTPKGPELSVCGNVWQRSKRDITMGGQCVDKLAAEIATWVVDPAKLARIVDVWQRYHLNGMKPGCAHQRATWDTLKPLTLTSYKWSVKYWEWRQDAGRGRLTPSVYAEFADLTTRVEAVTIASKGPKYETPEVVALLAEGWILADKTETKTAGWVYPSEHPEGMLCKPCEVCGYHYGSGWLYEPIPADVLAEVEGW